MRIFLKRFSRFIINVKCFKGLRVVESFNYRVHKVYKFVEISMLYLGLVKKLVVEKCLVNTESCRGEVCRLINSATQSLGTSLVILTAAQLSLSLYIKWKYTAQYEVYQTKSAICLHPVSCHANTDNELWFLFNKPFTVILKLS